MIGLKDLDGHSKTLVYQTNIFDPTAQVPSNVVKVDCDWINVLGINDGIDGISLEQAIKMMPKKNYT